MRQPHSQQGMTSLEVLCATLLATLLMATVLGIISGLARHQKTVDLRDPKTYWTRQVQRQLSRDFQVAEQIDLHLNGFSLTGSIGSDPKTGVANWLPASVDYRVVESDTSKLGLLLIRSERQLPPNPPNQQTEIVCTNIVQLQLMTSTIEAEAELDMPVPQREDQPFVTDLEQGPLPPGLIVTLLSQSDAVITNKFTILRQ